MNRKIELLKQANTDKKRNVLLRKYWGQDAHCYSDHYWLSKETNWEDIYMILTVLNARSVSVYLKVGPDSFVNYSWEQMLKEADEAEKKWGISNALEIRSKYHSFWNFQAKGNKNGIVYVDLEQISSDKIVARTVAKEGSHGDEDGYGVEPDTWVSAVLDREGSFVQPFYLG